MQEEDEEKSGRKKKELEKNAEPIQFSGPVRGWPVPQV